MAAPVVVPKPAAKGGAAGSRPRKRIRLTPRQALHIAHRAGILVMALQYVILNFQASWYTMQLLTLTDIPSVVSSPTVSAGIAAWIGTTTVRDSPLLVSALGDSTSTRNGTLYLDESGASFSVCASMATKRQPIYEDAFQRKLFKSYLDNTSYSGSFLATGDVELIAPVVDCLSNNVIIAAESTAIFYYLVRRQSAPESVAIVVMSLYNQAYAVPEQHTRGPTAFTTVAVISDLQADHVDYEYAVSLHFPFDPFNFRVCTFSGTTSDNQWSLVLIPRNATIDIAKNITTASVSGFYVDSETDQAHIMHEVQLNEQNPIHAITRTVTQTKTLLRDTWGWVHFFQLFLGFELLFNLVPLVLVSYCNFKAGKLWMGDAFVSISSTITTRSVVILFSWYASRFWTLKEFCIHDAYRISGMSTLTIYDTIIRADLLGLYLSVCGILGMLTRERVDPLLACICFHIGFDSRNKISQIFPSVVDMASQWALDDTVAGIMAALDGQDTISPMKLWTSHELENTSPDFIITILGPIGSMLIFVVLQVIVVKIYYRIFPSKMRVLKRATDTGGSAAKSGGETSLLYKRVLTLFEIATGAELENRFGLMSSYENYVFFKGMKFASADGIYSNGFVIVNDKFLIPTSAYFKIIIMKLLRKRYTSIFMYEMAGTTVQQTARLVYPETMTFADLFHLNISILS